MHPEVQRRLWGALDEMDTCVLGVGEALEALTVDERAAIGRAMREDGARGDRTQMRSTPRPKAGVSDERKPCEEWASMSVFDCASRLRGSSPGKAASSRKVRPLPPGRTIPRRPAREAPGAERLALCRLRGLA